MSKHTPTTLKATLDELCKHTQVDYGYEKLVPSETNKTAQSILEQLKALLPEKKYTMEGSPLLLEHIGFNEAIELVEKAIEEWAK